MAGPSAAGSGGKRSQGKNQDLQVQNLFLRAERRSSQEEEGQRRAHRRELDGGAELPERGTWVDRRQSADFDQAQAGQRDGSGESPQRA